MATAGDEKLQSEAEYEEKGSKQHPKGQASKGFKSHLGTTRLGAFGLSSEVAPPNLAQPIETDPNLGIKEMYSKLVESKKTGSMAGPEEMFHLHAQKQQVSDKQGEAKESSKKDTLIELKNKIVSILQKIKAQSKDLEQMKQTNPEVYESIIQMTKAMILLGKEVIGEAEGLESPSKDEENDIEKKEYLKAKLPVGSVIDTSAQGTRTGGKMKVMDKDGTVSWISLRSGMVRGKDDHAVSSLRPFR